MAAALVIGLAPGLSQQRAYADEGSRSVDYITEDKFAPEGYGWGLNFTNVKVESGFTHEADLAQYYDRNQIREDETGTIHPGDDGYAAFLDGEGSNDSRYRLRYEGGTYVSAEDHMAHKIDAVVTLTDWTVAIPRWDDGCVGWTCPHGNKWWEYDEHDTFRTGVFVNPSYDKKTSSLTNFNFYTVGLTRLNVSVQYYYAGTATLAPIKGHMTCIDLDVGQGFSFDGSVTKAEVVSSNKFLTVVGGNTVTAPTNPVEVEPGHFVGDEAGSIDGPASPDYKYGLVGAYFNKMDGTDPKGNKVADPDDPVKLYFTPSWQGSNGTCQSFFAMTNEFITAPAPGDENMGDLDVKKTADKTEGVSLGDEVTYTVDTPVHTRGIDCRYGYSYTDMEIVDVLPAEMRYVEGSGYLADAAGNKISNAGEVVYEGDGDAGRTENTVKFEFARDYLENGMAMQGEHYRFVFKAVLTEYPENGDLHVVNSSYVDINRGGRYDSNDVKTTLLKPEWKVDKQADKYEYEVGDVIAYTATFTQTVKNAQCRESVLSDNLPEGMKLVPGSVKATGLKNLPEPEIDGNMWSYTLDKFNYGDVVTVTYQAVAEQSGNGVEQVNIAAAHANNTMDGNDPAEVWTNTAKLDVQKDADYYEHYVGASDRDPGAVLYTVVVENDKAGTIAKNVVVSDDSLPEGMKVGRNNDGSLMVDVEGVPETVAYPVAKEDTVHNQTETRDVTYKTEASGTGFKTTIDYLPADAPVTITYKCYPEESIAGWEVVNTATATADNALDEEDDAKVWVNQPGLKVDKQASMKEYNVGDFVTYHIKVTNETPGTLARNVVVSDLMDVKGVELQRDSIKVYDSKGEDITASCTLHYNHNEPTFLVETNRNLVSASGKYTQWDEGEIEKAGDNPLGTAGETEFTVDYTVAITSAELAGTSLENHALAASDEPNTKTTDDELIYVKGAKMTVDKSSDKTSYQEGETGTYTVKATQIREHADAENVAIEDALDPSAARYGSIVEGSVAVKNMKGEAVDAEVSYTKDDAGDVTGFKAQTEETLSDGDWLTATYKVSMKAATDSLRNAAQASADNAVGGTDDNEVEITGERADATLEKSVDRQQAKVRDKLSYTVTGKILGADAKGVVISDKSMPEGIDVDFNSFSVDVNGKDVDFAVTHEGNGWSIPVGDLELGDVVTVSFEAKIQDTALAGKRIVNNAYLAAANIDGERMAQAIVAVDDADEDAPTLTKGSDVQTAEVGGKIAYTVKVGNGGKALRNAVVTDDTLPEGVSIDYGTFTVKVNGAKIDAELVNKSKNAFTVSLGKLSADDEVTIAYTATVDSEELAGTEIENTATLTSTDLDEPVSDDNVVAVPAKDVDATLSKDVDKAEAGVGDPLVYTIEANAGSKGLKAAVLTDLGLPEDASIDYSTVVAKIDGKPAAADVVGTDDGFRISLGNLAAGSDVSVSFKAHVGKGLAGETVVNTARLASTDLEKPLVDDATTVVTSEAPTPTPTPDPSNPAKKAPLALSKSVDRNNASAGDAVTWTVAATVGDEAVKNAVLKDELPANCTLDPSTFAVKVAGNLVEVTPQLGDGNFALSLGDLAAGTAVEVSYQTKLGDVPETGTWKNTASVEADGVDPVEASASVAPPADNPLKGVDKTGDPLAGWAVRSWPLLLLGAAACAAAFAAVPRLAKPGRRDSGK